ncbi:MAG: DNA-processing protein DprA [Actinomyces urogenitalis]|uniref:DNA-processing protein DprA n=1 Tax=Actinomyces urogenitalis TaxID=103621 RepID=UPI00290C0BAE|nr:DNA-processing protein DprA [Actinomyces urogenitalis]MDU6151385.1 DNA-processing protein DprA [Actinomyces urogenitalis]
MSPRPRLPYDLCDPVLARATWSRLAEPADRAAALLISRLGASGALEWLLGPALDDDGEARPAPAPPVRTPGDQARASAAWGKAAARWAPRLSGLDIRRELEVLERLGGSLVLPGDAWWPQGLDELDQPPACLWVRGDPALLACRSDGADPAQLVCRPDDANPAQLACRSDGADSTMRPSDPGRFRQDLVAQGPATGLSLALVGSRASTRYGEQVASQMAAQLADHGAVVVSGGAYGIDAAAHRGALRTGRTISVSAGGVDRLYPAGNATLLQEVIEHGALVAEVPPGCQPGRHRFLSRNRLIAAMSQATVLIEAAWRSGALSTARHAADLGRPLGAVPGPVTSMESAGCHRLLREGAVCVTDADEALELVLPLGLTDPEADKEADPARAGSGLLDGLDRSSAAVLDAMPARGAASVEALARSAGLAESEVRAALGLLELAGKVCRDPRGWWRRASSGSASA